MPLFLVIAGQNSKEGNMLDDYNTNRSLNELCSKKEIVWMNSLINIPIKAEERSMIQILFRIEDLNIKKATICGIRAKIHC